MTTGIRTLVHEGVGEGFVTRIRGWAGEVLERRGKISVSPQLCLMVWKSVDALRDFCRREKEALGVVTGEETDFLAIHDAWRGYPRVQVCEERLRGIPDPIIRGAVHHEMGHALHHGSQAFYAFRFSSSLLETGRAHGLDPGMLQHCVYFLSVAVKDLEVVQWLAEIGLGSSQIALLEHLVADTDEESQSWEFVRGSPALKKIALAALLKTLLPIEAMIAVGIREGRSLRRRWHEAYGWLPEGDRQGLSQLAECIMSRDEESFQERLEHAAWDLICRG